MLSVWSFWKLTNSGQCFAVIFEVDGVERLAVFTFSIVGGLLCYHLQSYLCERYCTYSSPHVLILFEVVELRSAFCDPELIIFMAVSEDCLRSS